MVLSAKMSEPHQQPLPADATLNTPTLLEAGHAYTSFYDLPLL